ncbi:MAG: phosphotransferase [Campylobacterales bacterium]|nr:phosphotransferase [Campylobacterales bacterium]
MQEIKSWLEHIEFNYDTIQEASSDASFRRYYRLIFGEQSFILMDASKQKAALKPHIDISMRLEKVGVNVPRILKQDIAKGYLIIEDFGEHHLFDILKYQDREMQLLIYKKAIDVIVRMQRADTFGLPLYDKDFLLFEMDLMQEWYLEKHLKKELNNAQKEQFKDALLWIADEILSQPQDTFVHRDFHSRNIMVQQNGRLGVIDFQDARCGAITYDLVSLLKDCYVELEEDVQKELALYFRDQKGLSTDDERFLYWFDMMGLQRHIKILGIFARLALRDGKDGYLQEIPLTLRYVQQTAKKYPQAQGLLDILA